MGSHNLVTRAQKYMGSRDFRHTRARFGLTKATATHIILRCCGLNYGYSYKIILQNFETKFTDLTKFRLPKVTKYRETKFRRIKIPTKRAAHFFIHPSGSLGEMT
jgi:hypothetical protein